MKMLSDEQKVSQRLLLFVLASVVLGSAMLYVLVIGVQEPVVYIITAVAVSSISLYLLTIVTKGMRRKDLPATTKQRKHQQILTWVGLVEFFTGILIPIPLLSHNIDLSIIPLLIVIFCNSIFKIIYGRLIKRNKYLQQIVGMSFIIDGLLLAGVYSIYTRQGLFAGGLVQYTLVTLGVLVQIGMGIEIIRGKIQFIDTA